MEELTMAKDIKDMDKDSSLEGMEDMPENNDWEINIDKLLEQADMLVNNDMLPPMPEFEEESNKREAGIGIGPGAKKKANVAEPKAEAAGAVTKAEVNAAQTRPKNDAGESGTEVGTKETGAKAGDKSGADALSSQNTDMDPDLKEINSLLAQADFNEKVDEDMLALLESAAENQEDEDNPDEVFDIFSDDDMPSGDMGGNGVSEPEQEEEENGKKKKRERKKKAKKERPKKEKVKKEKKQKNASEDESEAAKREKKPGFLTKIVALFGGGEDFDEEEPDSAADKNIAKLNDRDGGEGKKPAKKGRKKKENDKEKQDTKEAKPKANSKAKARVKVKEKKPTAKKRKEKPAGNPAEKPVRILNGKSFAAIAGLCFSIVAGVMIVATFIPKYVDKQTAVRAFQDRDYETVYQLFYNQKLSADEELLFQRSKAIRQMERRLEAYQNNITLGRELEAVDALMRGVENYPNLWEADEYQVRGEVDALYGQICEILESNYGISQEEAVEIASYDKVEYTKALYTILGGDGINFGEEESAAGEGAASQRENGGGEAASEPGDSRQPEGELSEDTSSGDTSSDEVPPEDMLPAEEDMMN